jgi:ubiquitin-protein ligase
MFARRVVKDIELLKKNETYLKEKGIFFHAFDDNLTKMSFLISPRHKEETSSNLISPYTGGFFLFEMTFPNDYPMYPPKIVFNPKTSSCRFHPNYYTCGKVCLSVVNTWGSQDWSPAMSVMALLITIEERFFERALGCEPGYGNTTITMFKQYNDFVEYYKYKIAIIDIIDKKYTIYEPFYDIIAEQVQQDYEWHLNRLHTLIETMHRKFLIVPLYDENTIANYVRIKDELTRICNKNNSISIT